MTGAARATAAAMPVNASDAVAAHARMRPETVALVSGDASLTYGELDGRADLIAAALWATGMRPGDHVAYLGKNSNEFMEALIGTLRIGGVFTPLNWRLAPAELAFMLQDCAATLVIADAEHRSNLQTLALHLPSLRCRVGIGMSATDGWEDYADWRDQRREGFTRHAAQRGEPALLIYTSGTTGRPKGVMLSHRNVRSMAGVEYGAGWPEWNLWAPHDHNLAVSPMFHVGGMGWVMRGLFPGCKQVLLREFSSAGVIDAIVRHGITRVGLVPSAMGMVLQDPAAASADFSSLKYVYYGASPIPLDLLREGMRIFGCGFVQSYGQTETSSSIVCLAPEDHTLEDAPHMRSAGKPMPGVELEVRDAAGAALPPHAIGEIVTRSTSNMIGYLNLPDETAATVDAEGWLHSGDAGYLDEHGFVYVQDRIREMIITGGENVYPAEVENAIYGHPAVSAVAVIGVPSAKWGQAVKAVVVLRPGQSASESEIVAWARERIGGYKLPKSVDFADDLPCNTAGKVVKSELRKRYSAV